MRIQLRCSLLFTRHHSEVGMTLLTSNKSKIGIVSKFKVAGDQN